MKFSWLWSAQCIALEKIKGSAYTKHIPRPQWIRLLAVQKEPSVVTVKAIRKTAEQL
jgi:hypothetical protein